MYFKLPKPLQNSVRTTVLPAHPDDPSLIPYLPVVCMEGPFGQLYRQKLTDQDFVLYRQVFRIRHPTPLRLQVTTPQIILNYMQRGSLFCELKGYGKVMLAAGTAQLFYVPSGLQTICPDTGEYVISHVHLSADYLQPLAGENEGLRSVCQGIAYELTSARQGYAGSIHPDSGNILDRIQHCQLPAGARMLFLQARIRDLLLRYLEDTDAGSKRSRTRYQFTKEDMYRLEHARKEAALHLFEPLTMRELAKRVNMHPRKLEAGLREVYGLPAKLMIRKLRIEKAKTLLRESEASVADIAYECGYQTVSAFVRAFHAEEGHTPINYRK